MREPSLVYRAPAEPSVRGRLPWPPPVAVWLVVIYLLSVAFHVRALTHEAEFPLLATDEAQYIAVGDSIRLGHGFTIRGEFDAALPPVYPLFVAFAHSWGSDARMSALFFSCAFMSLALFPAYGLARFVGLDAWLAGIAASAAVFLPNTVLAGLYMTETISYPLFLTTFWMVARWLERPSAMGAVVAGTLLSLMLLTKVAAFSFAGAVLVAVLVLSVIPRRWNLELVRPGASTVVVAGLVVVTQLGWQGFKSRHGAAGLGMYGRVLGESGLPHLSASLLGAYVADFLLAPGLLVVVPLVLWFRRHCRDRMALAALLAAMLLLQIAVHGVIDTGLVGLVQERLYLHALPIIAIVAIAGLGCSARVGAITKAALVTAPLALVYLLGRYGFPYIPVIDMPWIAALGSPGIADVLHFDKSRALLAAAALIGAMAIPLCLLPGRRAQIALATFIAVFNLTGFVSSAKKMSVLSTMGRPATVHIMDWLSANQMKPGDRLVICGALAYFEDRHRVTPVDQFFVEWHRRFGLSAIADLQLEASGRFDVRMAASPDQISAVMTPGDRLLTATRMTGLRLVGTQYPLYLYTLDRPASEPIRPLYLVDPSPDTADGPLPGAALAQETPTTDDPPVNVPAGAGEAPRTVDGVELYPMCGLTSFNGAGPAPMYSVQQGDVIDVRGWSDLAPESAAVKEQVQVQVESGARQYGLPTRQSPRARSGTVAFRARMASSLLPPAAYRVRVVRSTGPHADACANFWNLTVTAPQARPEPDR